MVKRPYASGVAKLRRPVNVPVRGVESVGVTWRATLACGKGKIVTPGVAGGSTGAAVGGCNAGCVELAGEVRRANRTSRAVGDPFESNAALFGRG